ncbi:glycoside hydrolase [Thraustotheca clavata]|uniref:glucan endo-1,3-beta-D-glucosidase n=1 Tax=Thraustotheca clavata TaxID=74557 RepID=A0A0A7CLA7_9STRA|nr:secreted protein [Thraustotheca clavata]OQS06781.1 glycoside hydrolase [Thraustotheca clavata]
MIALRIVRRYLAASLLLLSLVHPAQSLVGICYDNYQIEAIHNHFQMIKQRFGAVRTFQTLNKGVNAVDAAAKAGLKIAAGVWIRANNYKADLDAAIDGARRHPDTVHAIFIGNEDLLGNAVSIDFVVLKVQEAKDKLKQAGLKIKIGSVQTDGDWMRAPQLAAICDILGVNIYPFFGGSSVSASNPIQDLDARWNTVKQQYGDKVLLTETGWPNDGGNYGAHVSNQANAQAYFQAFKHWVQQGNGGSIPYYFMFHDNPSKHGFERYFGLADTSAHWKYDFASLSGDIQAQSPKKFQIRSNDGQIVYQNNGAVMAHKKSNEHTKDENWLYFSDTNTVVNQGNQQCLDLASDQHIQTYMCASNNTNQQWSLRDNHLVQTSFNVCLETNQGNVAVNQCTSIASNQQFNFE